MSRPQAYDNMPLSSILAEQKAEKIILLIQQKVYEIHQTYFHPLPYPLILTPGEEADKNTDTLLSLIAQLSALHADRNTLLVCVGGGALLDIGGFLGSIYMRSCPTAYVPTTLLAQCDACMGGKTALNVGKYKNLIGSFHMPRFILWDSVFLNTLSDTQYAEGFAEIIKHALIHDKELWQLLQKNNPAAFKNNPALLNALILKNRAVKTYFIEADYQEQGIRKYLNFGHTLGHSLEKEYHLTHGTAVGLGMLLALKTGIFLEKTPPHYYPVLQQTLTRYGLPTQLPSFQPSALYERLLLDKKRQDNQLHFVLLSDIGRPFIEAIDLSKLSDLLTQIHF